MIAAERLRALAEVAQREADRYEFHAEFSLAHFSDMQCAREMSEIATALRALAAEREERSGAQAKADRLTAIEAAAVRLVELFREAQRRRIAGADAPSPVLQALIDAVEREP